MSEPNKTTWYHLGADGSRTYQVRAWIDSDYCVYAADLPGCVSQGDSIASCGRAIVEAFKAVVESYESDGVTIPFDRGKPRPLFHEERYFLARLEPTTPPQPETP